MKHTIEEAWQDIKTQRDELRVQMHLAKAELRDEFEKLEPEFEKAEHKLEEIKDDAIETGQEISRAVGVMTEELGQAYRRIRDRLKED